jgi:hypothetical protein
MKFLPVCFSFLLLLASCGREEKACTALFASYGVTVRDTLNKPASLSSHYTQISATGEKLFPATDSFQRAEGFYTVITDLEIRKLSQRGTEVRFIGLADSVEAVNIKYIFGHDGCHIRILEGPSTVTVK